MTKSLAKGAVTLSLVVAVACGEAKQDDAAPLPKPSGLAGGNPATTSGDKPALLDLPPDTVVVEVNGTALDRRAFGRALKNQLMAVGKPIGELPEELRLMVQHRAYMQMVEREILRQKGVEKGLVPPPEVLEKSVSDFKARVPPGKTFEGFLADMEVDEASFKKEMESNLVIGALIESIEREIPPVDEAAAKAVFEANKAFYSDNRSSTGRQIVVRVLPVAPPEEVERALARINEIRASVVGKSEDAFAAVAREKSEDIRTREKGGDMGTFTTKDILPELVEPVFALKKGQVSEPIRTERGFHIVRSGGVDKGKPRTFADVKDQIIASESMKRKTETMDQAVRGIIESAKIVEHHTPPEPPRQGFPPPGAMGGPKMPQGAPPHGPGGPPGQGMPPPPSGPHGAPGASHGELPLPSKDNVLPGVKNPHGAPSGTLKLGGGEDQELKLNPTP